MELSDDERDLLARIEEAKQAGDWRRATNLTRSLVARTTPTHSINTYVESCDTL